MHTYLDTKYILMYTLMGLSAFLVPIAPLMGLVGLAIVVDTVFGLIKAFKIKEAITSRKFAQVVLKMFVYQVAILTIYMLDRFLLHGLVSGFTEIPYITTKLASLVIILSELKSINENVNIITGVNFINFFKKLLKSLRNDLGTIKDIKSLKND